MGGQDFGFVRGWFYWCSLLQEPLNMSISAFVLGASHPIQGAQRHQIHAQFKQVEPPMASRQARGETATVPVVLLAGAVSALVGACREKRQGVEKGRGCKVASRAFESELGVQAPVGFWDPLRFAISGDVEEFKRRRATEIKHGRVSMIACIGYIVPEFFKWPGMLSPSQGVYFSDIPNGIQALSKIPGVGIFQWFLFCGFIETGAFKQEDERPAGDFKRGGVLGVPNGSSLPKGETRDRKLNAEIANGRLAMMAIMGMLFQDGLTGSAWGDWELYTASPLR